MFAEMSQECIPSAIRCYPLHWVKSRKRKETRYQVPGIFMVLLAFRKRSKNIFYDSLTCFLFT